MKRLIFQSTFTKQFSPNISTSVSPLSLGAPSLFNIFPRVYALFSSFFFFLFISNSFSALVSIVTMKINGRSGSSIAATISQDPGSAGRIPNDPAPVPAGPIARRKRPHLIQLPFP